MKKKSIAELNAEIDQANADYAAYTEAKDKELESIAARVEQIAKEAKQKQNTHQAKVEQLQRDRDALALEKKLESFPKSLVEGHKFCKVCNAAMRPFEVMESGESVRYWGCQNGSLRIDHDLVKVSP